MNCIVSNRVNTVLLLCFVQSFLVSQAHCQHQRIELTEPTNSLRGFQAAVGGVVLWRNSHAIVHFDNSLRRYSLVDAREEVLVYDLKKIPSLASKRRFNSNLRSSKDGSWILLESSGKDPTTGCNCYLFDSSAWSCRGEIEPVSQWHSDDLNWGAGSQILQEPGLIVIPKDLGTRSVLEIRELDFATEIKQSVKVGGRYVASWWDENRGLVVLCMNPPFIASRDYTLSQIDIDSGRITKRVNWQLPFKFGIFHRMPETATVLQQSDGAAGHENYFVEFGRPAKRLLSKIPLTPNIKIASKNGRYLAGNYIPYAAHHYLLDLAQSKELASFDAPNELPIAVSDDGRFYLTALENGDGKTHRLQIVLYDFQKSVPDAPNGYGE